MADDPHQAKPGSPPREPRPPEALARMQRAFARSIALPFAFTDRERGDYSLAIDHYDLDLLRDIRPRPPASAAERLGVYNRQYWFRLLSVMQEEYPLTQHLLGVTEFNRMVMAYLVQWPSRHYSLNHLSDRLARFLDQDHEWNRPLLIQSAALEYAFIRAFDARAEPAFEAAALDHDERAALIDQPLVVQPHLHLFEEHWNLVECRRDLARGEPEVAPVPGHGFWVVHREPATGRCVAEPLGPLPYRLLAALRDRVPLGRALDSLIDTLDREETAFLAANIENWLRGWVASGWFVRP